MLQEHHLSLERAQAYNTILPREWDMICSLLGGAIDVLMLQEHHLSIERAQTYNTILPGERDMFWVPAIVLNQTHGGVCMAIADKWKSLIVEKFVVVPGRAQLVVLRMQSQNWGFLNIYSPKHEIPRVQFWRNLIQSK